MHGYRPAGRGERRRDDAWNDRGMTATLSAIVEAALDRAPADGIAAGAARGETTACAGHSTVAAAPVAPNISRLGTELAAGLAW